VLLDTCTLLWLCGNPKKLSNKVKECIDSEDTEIVVSLVSVWEMGLKTQSGKMKFPKPLRRWIHDQREIWKFDVLSISLEHILTTNELPEHHKDPFDRLLIAQALRNNIPFLTPDKIIAEYPVEVIW
jgi:PIN domain nuclease of toxin-antitoxin system